MKPHDAPGANDGMTAYTPLHRREERLILAVVRRCDRFDLETFTSEYLPYFGEEATQIWGGKGVAAVDMRHLELTAERLCRKGSLRKVGESYYHVADLISEDPVAARERSPLDEAPPGVLHLARSDRIVVDFTGGAAKFLDNWNPDEIAADDGPDMDRAAWAAEARACLDGLQRSMCLSLGDVETLVRGWAREWLPAAASEDATPYQDVVQQLLPTWMHTPRLWIHREMRSGITESPRVDRYRRYALALTGALRRGRPVPPVVLRACLREFDASWAAIRGGLRQAGANAAEAVEIGIEQMVARSLIEVLFAAGVMPGSISAELLGDARESQLERYREIYAAGLARFGLLGADDFIQSFDSRDADSKGRSDTKKESAPPG